VEWRATLVYGYGVNRTPASTAFTRRFLALPLPPKLSCSHVTPFMITGNMQCILIIEVSEWCREGVVFVEWASKRSGGRAGSGEREGEQLPGQVPHTCRARKKADYPRGARDIEKEYYYFAHMLQDGGARRRRGGGGPEEGALAGPSALIPTSPWWALVLFSLVMHDTVGS
jgi:hypothetical protein